MNIVDNVIENMNKNKTAENKKEFKQLWSIMNIGAQTRKIVQCFKKYGADSGKKV